MDLVKRFTDSQRRVAKQQKQPANVQTGAGKQEKQVALCRFCKWGTPELTAANYLQHLRDAHGDALDKTELGDETTHVTLKEIDDALDGSRTTPMAMAVVTPEVARPKVQHPR